MATYFLRDYSGVVFLLFDVPVSEMSLYHRCFFFFNSSLLSTVCPLAGWWPPFGTGAPDRYWFHCQLQNWRPRSIFQHHLDKISPDPLQLKKSSQLFHHDAWVNHWTKWAMASIFPVSSILDPFSEEKGLELLKMQPEVPASSVATLLSNAATCLMEKNWTSGCLFRSNQNLIPI